MLHEHCEIIFNKVLPTQLALSQRYGATALVVSLGGNLLAAFFNSSKTDFKSLTK